MCLNLQKTLQNTSMTSEIRRTISLNNEEYKLAADMHRRSKEFNVGDYVMVCIRPERIPKTFSKKLYARAMNPYSIIRKLGSNAYLLDLLNDMDISPVFNIEDLLPYRGTFEHSTLPSSVSASETSKGVVTPRNIPMLIIFDMFRVFCRYNLNFSQLKVKILKTWK